MVCSARYAAPLFFDLVPLGAIPLLEIVFGWAYLKETGCSNATLLSPLLWLCAGGIATLSLALCHVSLVLYTFDDFPNLFLLTIALFNLPWSVIGAVSLWDDNRGCSPDSLYSFLVVSVVARLIFSAVTLKVLIVKLRLPSRQYISTKGEELPHFHSQSAPNLHTIV